MRLETFGQTFQDFEPKLDKAAYLEFASTPAARPLLSSSCFPENPTQTWELESRAAAVHTTSLGSGSCFLPPKIASRRITGGERDRMQPSTNRYTEPPQPRQPRWSTGRPAGRCLACPPAARHAHAHSLISELGLGPKAPRHAHGIRVLVSWSRMRMQAFSSHSGTVSCTNRGGLEAIPIRRAGGVGSCRHCRIVRR
jgi:hypothetical protein